MLTQDVSDTSQVSSLCCGFFFNLTTVRCNMKPICPYQSLGSPPHHQQAAGTHCPASHQPRHSWGLPCLRIGTMEVPGLRGHVLPNKDIPAGPLGEGWHCPPAASQGLQDSDGL